MKILFYSAHPSLNLASPAGYATHMLETISAFRELGHHVDTFIVGGEEESNAINNTSRSRTILKKVIPSLIWETIKDLKLIRNDKNNELKLDKLIKEYDPDLIYERGYYLLLSGVKSAKRSNCFHILEMNAPYPEERIKMSGKSLFHNYALRTEALQTSLTKRLVVVSGALKNYYSKINSNVASKTIIIPNAISESFIKSFSDIENQELKKKLNLENKLIIGFVGSIFPYHGVEMLVSAFKRKYGNAKEVGLLIVGDGVGLVDIMKSCNDLKNIVFTRNISSKDIPSHINLMDIWVMAKSNWYGSPVKIFEYGAYKKPVIVPKVSPVMEIIEDQKNGLFVDSEKELIHAMSKLVDDESTRSLIGEALYEQVIEKHTWKKNAIRILSDLI